MRIDIESCEDIELLRGEVVRLKQECVMATHKARIETIARYISLLSCDKSDLLGIFDMELGVNEAVKTRMAIRKDCIHDIEQRTTPSGYPIDFCKKCGLFVNVKRSVLTT